MTGSKSAISLIVHHDDYDVITPDTSKLRSTLRRSAPGESDPIARAENALARIAGDFPSWMQDECDRLDAARRKIKEYGLSKDNGLELSSAARDVKNNSGVFGFPAACHAADSLCRLIEYAPDLGNIPMAIIDQHVDAVRAIIREHARQDISSIATALTSRLREVTDEYLVQENQHRPDVLKAIRGPTAPP